MLAVLFISLFLCMLCTIPIALSLAISTIITSSVYFPARGMINMLAQSMVTTSDSFPLMAMPFFMLVGTLMDRSGIAKRLVAVAEALVGSVAGGLGTACIVAAMFFAAISGSGPAVVAALGSVLVPAMVARSYDADYAGAVIASAATIGPVIPPSIPMIVYGVSIGVSVTKMFTAGFIPGIIMGIALMIVNYFISKKRGYRGIPRAGGFTWIRKQIFSGLPALLMPVIVLGGIYAGFFTPTESAVVGVMYSLIVGVFIYRELTPGLIKEALVEAGLLSAPVMILLGGATTFGRLLSLAHIPEMLANAMLSFSRNPIVIMLLINVFLLITGMFIDTTSNIVLFAPLFVPIVVEVGYDPVFFGVIMVINLCIGFLTPPLGMNLFVAQGIANVSLESIVKQVLPFIAVLCAVLVLLMLFPDIVMFLPNAVGL